MTRRASGPFLRWSRRDESLLVEQAQAMADLLPTVMRRLFTFEDDAAEELPLGQLRVCALLYDEPRLMSALSRELGVSLSAMTQIADRLERGQLVQRVAVGTDRRVRCLKLTERGEEMMRRREEARVRSVLAILEHLPRPARKEILAALKLLERACAAPERCAEPG
jgi:DNA-binding MarR family transcriptional regulator